MRDLFNRLLKYQKIAFYTALWDEDVPTGGEARSLGDNRIRDLKRDLRERLASEHTSLTATGGAATLEHKPGQCKVLYATGTSGIASLTGVHGGISWDTQLCVFKRWDGDSSAWLSCKPGGDQLYSSSHPEGTPISADGSGGSQWGGSYVAKISKNLIITCAAVSLYTVDINADMLDVEGVKATTLDLTVDLAASGTNGLDAGTKAKATWYYVWVIYNPTTATFAGLFSTSSTSPTMPSGYTKKRLVGAARTDTSTDGHIVPYRQIGNVVYYIGARESLTGGKAATATSVNLNSAAVCVPSMAEEVLLTAKLMNSTTAGARHARLGFTGDVAGTNCSITLSVYGAYDYNTTQVRIPCPSQQVRYAVTGTFVGDYAGLTLEIQGYIVDLV